MLNSTKHQNRESTSHRYKDITSMERILPVNQSAQEKPIKLDINIAYISPNFFLSIGINMDTKHHQMSISEQQKLKHEEKKQSLALVLEHTAFSCHTN